MKKDKDKSVEASALIKSADGSRGFSPFSIVAPGKRNRTSGEPVTGYYRCDACNGGQPISCGPPDPAPYTVAGCGTGWGAAAVGVEADATAGTAKKTKRADTSAGILAYRTLRVTEMNQKLAPTPTEASMSFTTPLLGYSPFASCNSTYANLRKHLTCDKHQANMAAWHGRNRMLGFPAYMPKPGAGIRLCKLLLSESTRLQEGPQAGNSDDTAVHAVEACGISEGPEGSNTAAVIAAVGSEDEDDMALQLDERRDDVQLNEEEDGADINYDSKEKKWVRCPTCESTHQLMLCCVRKGNGLRCLQYCEAFRGGAGVMVKCKFHPQYMHFLKEV